ncbi:hypothetical protein [Microbacterium sp. 77mftsu3.1]|uniref:hypothetical protein n=1 Tax=Microbacterium sp. 77mftsu3.1 TaxID=1761802 RepID=UPI000375F303|nr:hypothetical protein [Microbacterium sp. 77mftsu3.1]SDH53306.1 hypothetical protein SAMN04488590_3498 [Microbacterium sp. 77mftsu3.1]
MDIEWTKAGFEQLGFVGWKPLGTLAKGDLPAVHGVYVVTTPPLVSPEFLPVSVGGPHKHADLTVPVATLTAAWRGGAEILYIGKAGGDAGFKDRLWAYAKQGRGYGAGHFGGRYIWQLPASQQLVVGWYPTPGVDPGEVENALLAMHLEEFGVRPFANLTGGARVHPDKARALLSQVFRLKAEAERAKDEPEGESAGKRH